MDWTALHAQLHRTLRQRQLLERNQRLLVAVSGGQDSLCLIKLLLDLQPKWGWQLAIAHCNHRWRPDSQANTEHVEHLAQAWGVPFYCQAAVEIPISEAQARQWRYQVLAAIAQENACQYIVTGHTASDRAETLLYNLIRGSGTDGLQALTWQRPLGSNLSLVRPLLEITRAETAQFCQDFNLPVWEDSTNQNLQYARNRIRQELLPYLQAHFNPQVEQALAQTAEVLRADVAYLENAAAVLLQQAMPPVDCYQQHSDQLRLNRAILQAAPLALQRRAVRQFLQQVLPSSPSFDHIEKLMTLVTAANRSCTDPFPGGSVAEVEGTWICWKVSEENYSTETKSKGG
jgi:tRNA(Ile)-lysidine synthase